MKKEYSKICVCRVKSGLVFVLRIFLLFSHQWTGRNRSSHRGCSVKKGVFRNFAKFTGKHLCQSFFFDKVAVLRPASLLKKRLWHRCFLVNFTEFLRTSFLQNTSGYITPPPEHHHLLYKVNPCKKP